VAIVSPRVRGFRARAAIGLRCTGSLDDAAASLVPVEEIESLYAVAGRYDLLAEIQCADGEHLARTLAARVRTAGPVRSADVLAFLEIFKVRYPWPPARLPAGNARARAAAGGPAA
jgi:Lrp/AsnC family transcriptional regulator for asnA, asnC and gidA